MVNPKSHFFALTALSAAVIGLLLGAAFSFDDSDKIKNSGQISTMRPADVKTVWQAQQKKEETASQENFLKTKQEFDRQEQQVKQDSIAVAAASSFPGNAMEQTKAEQQPNAVPMKSRGVLNGYKGYRHHRPGYKNAGDGWWYPQAAFSSKAASTANSIQKEKQLKAQAAEREKKAALARQAESTKAKKLAEAKKHSNDKQAITERRAISRHIEWCASHHRSYDPNTNTYRSTFGTKRYCDTPYLHR